MSNLPEALEKLLKLHQKVVEEIFPKLQRARVEIAELILGPSFFGDEEFFRCYSIINDVIIREGPYNRFKSEFNYSKIISPEKQIFSAAYSAAGRLALVQNGGEDKTHYFYHADNQLYYSLEPSPIFKEEKPEFHRFRGYRNVTIDDLTKNGPYPECDNPFFIFLYQVLRDATELVLKEYEKVPTILEDKFPALQEDIVKLRAVASLSADCTPKQKK